MSSTNQNTLLSNEATRNNRFIQSNKTVNSTIPDWLIKLREERKKRTLLDRSNVDLMVKKESNIKNHCSNNANEFDGKEMNKIQANSAHRKECVENEINKLITFDPLAKLVNQSADNQIGTKELSIDQSSYHDRTESNQQVVNTVIILNKRSEANGEDRLYDRENEENNKIKSTNYSRIQVVLKKDHPINCSTIDDESDNNQMNLNILNNQKNLPKNDQGNDFKTHSIDTFNKSANSGLMLDDSNCLNRSFDSSVRMNELDSMSEMNMLKCENLSSKESLENETKMNANSVIETVLTMADYESNAKKFSESNEIILNSIESDELNLSAKESNLRQMNAETIAYSVEKSSIITQQVDTTNIDRECVIEQDFINKYQGCKKYELNERHKNLNTKIVNSCGSSSMEKLKLKELESNEKDLCVCESDLHLISNLKVNDEKKSSGLSILEIEAKKPTVCIQNNIDTLDIESINIDTNQGQHLECGELFEDLTVQSVSINEFEHNYDSNNYKPEQLFSSNTKLPDSSEVETYYTKLETVHEPVQAVKRDEKIIENECKAVIENRSIVPIIQARTRARQTKKANQSLDQNEQISSDQTSVALSNSIDMQPGQKDQASNRTESNQLPEMSEDIMEQLMRNESVLDEQKSTEEKNPKKRRTNFGLINNVVLSLCKRSRSFKYKLYATKLRQLNQIAAVEKSLEKRKESVPTGVDEVLELDKILASESFIDTLNRTQEQTAKKKDELNAVKSTEQQYTGRRKTAEEEETEHSSNAVGEVSSSTYQLNEGKCSKTCSKCTVDDYISQASPRTHTPLVCCPVKHEDQQTKLSELSALQSELSSLRNGSKQQVSENIIPLNFKIQTSNKVINKLIKLHNLLINLILSYKQCPSTDQWTLSTVENIVKKNHIQKSDSITTNENNENLNHFIRSTDCQSNVHRIVNLIKVINHFILELYSKSNVKNFNDLIVSNVNLCSNDQVISVQPSKDIEDTYHQCDLCNRNQIENLITEYISHLSEAKDNNQCEKHTIDSLTKCLLNCLSKFANETSLNNELSKNLDKKSNENNYSNDKLNEQCLIKSTNNLKQLNECSDNQSAEFNATKHSDKGCLTVEQDNTEDYCSIDSGSLDYDLLTTSKIKELIEANNQQVALKFKNQNFNNSIDFTKKIDQTVHRSNESLMNLKQSGQTEQIVASNEQQRETIRILNTKMALTTNSQNLIFDELDETGLKMSVASKFGKREIEDEEVEYGPGIVDKLKSRFLQYQQLSSKYGQSNGKLKRSSSLEDMLNCGVNKGMVNGYNAHQFEETDLKDNAKSTGTKKYGSVHHSSTNQSGGLLNGNTKYYTQQRNKQPTSSRHCNNKLKSLIIERASHIESNTLINGKQPNGYFKNITKPLKNGSCSSNSSSSSNNDDEEDDELDYFTLPVLKRAKSMETLTMELRNHQFTFSTTPNHETSSTTGKEIGEQSAIKMVATNGIQTSSNSSPMKSRFNRSSEDVLKQSTLESRKCNKQINKMNQQIQVNSKQSNYLKNSNQHQCEAVASNCNKLIGSNATSSNSNSANFTSQLTLDCGTAFINQSINHNLNLNSLAQSNTKSNVQPLSTDSNNRLGKVTNSGFTTLQQSTNHSNVNSIYGKFNQKEMISSQQTQSSEQETTVKNKELTMDDELPKPNFVKLCKRIFEQQIQPESTFINNFSKTYHSSSLSNLSMTPGLVNGLTSGPSTTNRATNNSTSTLNYSKYRKSSLHSFQQQIDRSTGDKHSDKHHIDKKNEIRSTNDQQDSRVNQLVDSNDHELINQFNGNNESDEQSNVSTMKARKSISNNISQVTTRESCIREQSVLTNGTNNTVEASANQEPRSKSELQIAFNKLNQTTRADQCRTISDRSLKTKQGSQPIVPPKPVHLLKQHTSRNEINLKEISSKENTVKENVPKEASSKETSDVIQENENLSNLSNSQIRSSMNGLSSVTDHCDKSDLVACDQKQNEQQLKPSTLTRKPCIYICLKTTKPEIVRRKSIEPDDESSGGSSLEEDQYDDIRLNDQTIEQFNNFKKDINQSVYTGVNSDLKNSSCLSDSAHKVANLNNINCNLNRQQSNDHNEESEQTVNSNRLIKCTGIQSNESAQWLSGETKTNNKNQEMNDCFLINTSQSNSVQKPAIQDSSSSLDSPTTFSPFCSSQTTLNEQSEPVVSLSPNDQVDSNNQTKNSTLNSQLNNQSDNTTTGATYLNSKGHREFESSTIDRSNTIIANNQNLKSDNEMRSYTLPSFLGGNSSNSSKIAKKPVANIKPLIQDHIDLSTSINQANTSVSIANKFKNSKLNEQINQLKDQLKDSSDLIMHEKLKQPYRNDDFCAKLTDQIEQSKSSIPPLKKNQAPQPPVRQQIFSSLPIEGENSAIDQTTISSISSNSNDVTESTTGTVMFNLIDSKSNKQCQVNDKNLEVCSKLSINRAADNNDVSASFNQSADINTDLPQSPLVVGNLIDQEQVNEKYIVNSNNNNSVCDRKLNTSSSVSGQQSSQTNVNTTNSLNNILNKKKIDTSNQQSGSTSVVFDFRGTNVKANVKVRANSGYVIRSSEEEDDFNYTGITEIPSPSGIVFDGENVQLEKSSILTTRNKRLKIKFDDGEDDVFEYPSDQDFMIKTYDCHTDVQTNGFKSNDNEKDEKVQKPPIPKRSKNSKLTSTLNSTNSSLKNNTIIGVNGNLSSYKPNSLSSNFELGVTRRIEDKSIKSNDQPEINDDSNEEFQTMLKPANSNETKSFSISTKASDLLF